MALVDAAKSGDRRLALVATRDALAVAMEDCPPTVLAQLAGQLRATLKELDELPAGGVVSSTDELRLRRAARRKERGA